MTGLIVGFKQYEHQGIDLVLERTPGGGHVLKTVRRDTGAVLLRVELPQNLKIAEWQAL